MRSAAATPAREVGVPAAAPPSPTEPSGWRCVKHCGACCYLAPEDRPYLADILSTEELAVFRGLVGPDGWCRHFDAERRFCKIYDDRPSFCRVKTWLASKADGFGVDASDEAALAGFCADCCREHVRDVYGQTSEEMVRFDSEVTVRGPEDGQEEAALELAPGWEADEEFGSEEDEDFEEASDGQGQGAEEDEWDEAEEDEDEDDRL